MRAEDKTKIIISVIVIAVVVAVGVLYFIGRQENKNPTNKPPSKNIERQKPLTRESVPQRIGDWDVSAPGENATTVPENVAVPKTVSVGNAAGTANKRIFDIEAEGDKFIPNIIVVNQNDTVRINITAVDRDYDFTQPDYGFKELVRKGATKKIQFDASASGRFMFYCSACGGPDKGPTGYLIIKGK